MTWRELQNYIDRLDDSEVERPVELLRADGHSAYAVQGPYTESAKDGACRRVFLTVGMGRILTDAEYPNWEEVKFLERF